MWGLWSLDDPIMFQTILIVGFCVWMIKSILLWIDSDNNSWHKNKFVAYETVCIAGEISLLHVKANKLFGDAKDKGLYVGNG